MGVSKSGSPCDRPMTSRPWRRSSFASRVMAIVGEGRTACSRDESRVGLKWVFIYDAPPSSFESG
jgi:hypothetical protein